MQFVLETSEGMTELMTALGIGWFQRSVSLWGVVAPITTDIPITPSYSASDLPPHRTCRPSPPRCGRGTLPFP